jgi:hypothetical protein
LQANYKKEESESEKENHEGKKEIKEERKKRHKANDQQKSKGTALIRKDEYIRKLRIYEKNRVKSFSVSSLI